MTIEQAEAIAANDSYSQCKRTIRGQVLRVERFLSRDGYRFEYQWGKNMVPRDVAASVLATE
jgi:hypothetical protein